MLEVSLSSLAFLLSGLCIAYITYWAIKITTDPLRDLPGPFLARFTHLWYLYQVYLGHFELVNIRLHQTYGPIVRIAPNEYSIDDPEAVKTIYGTGTKFVKASFYWAWQPPVVGQSNIFSDQDPHHHALQRRKFAAAYSMTSVIQYEPYVDECTTILAQKFTEQAGQTIDIGHWLHCCAVDVVSCITYTKRLGLLDAGKDEGKIFEAIEQNNVYGTFIGIVPFLHRYLFPILLSPKGFGALLAFGMKNIAACRERFSQSRTTTDGPRDFMTKLIAAQDEDPTFMNDFDMMTISIANIAAGSDTTAITLSALFHLLLTHPQTFKSLQQEIDKAAQDGKISNPITFKEAQQLEYLQAVIKETIRMHPAVGMPLPRTVPSSGALIHGRHFPPGCTVGCNAWVLHRNTSTYGSDAHIFRPERWLEMGKIEGDGYGFAFGMGSRTCIGKNISMLELNKIVVQLVRKFEFELEDVSVKGWKTETRFFVKPMALRGRVFARQSEK